MGNGASTNDPESTLKMLAHEASKPADASDLADCPESARTEVVQCRAVAAALMKQLGDVSAVSSLVRPQQAADTFSVGHYNVLAVRPRLPAAPRRSRARR